jgi:uncharacterized membrane protein
MNRVLGRFRNRMTSGIVVLIPLVVTVYALKILFGLVVGILLPFIDPAVDHWPAWARGMLSLGILVLLVYLLGEVAAHMVGRRLLSMAEAVVLKVPLVRVIYGASKHVASAFQRKESSAFRSVVMVEFPRPGMKALGFLTSSFRRPDGTEWMAVFVPTTPNPTTGFLQVVAASEVVLTDFTVEQAFEMIMSLGVLMPPDMGSLPEGAPAVATPPFTARWRTPPA